MTANLVIEFDICPDCDGSGALPTGEREHETGQWVTTPCGSCDSGTVDARTVSECESCTTRFWAGGGCEHVGIRCVDCKGSCGDCRVEAQAVVAFDVWRDKRLIGGAA